MKESEVIFERIIQYIVDSQDFKPGEYYGAFWSEKAYHGPLLDWHGGGSHHHRGAGSAALALWSHPEYRGRAEAAFDWVVARQSPRGGWREVQNNEKTSDWENTGLDELSTIETGFAIHGLGNALLLGLPPKKSYMDSLLNAGHWLLSLEWPAGSGVYPHHERSPYDTLNANATAVESLALIYQCLRQVYQREINIFLQGAKRGFEHTIDLAWPNGCLPYRRNDGSTINYTSVVLWCFLNTMDVLPEGFLYARSEQERIENKLKKNTEFLRGCVLPDGSLDWEDHETSSAKYNIWSYVITMNVLVRVGGKENLDAASRIFGKLLRIKTESGLLPMRDRGEEITECLFMQADIALFLQPLSRFGL